MEKISWTDRVRNVEVLYKVKKQRNIVHRIQRREANWIGHILRKNCFLKDFILEEEVREDESEVVGS